MRGAEGEQSTFKLSRRQTTSYKGTGDMAGQDLPKEQHTRSEPVVAPASSVGRYSNWVRLVGVGSASAVLSLGLAACDTDADDRTPAGHESSARAGGAEASGEHRGDGEGSGEHGPEGERSESGEYSGGERAEDGLGEESGTELALTDTFDQMRAGTRLNLVYDSGENAFVGTVENLTESVLDRVRVEVHLSNGVELGPTTPVDLAPGQTVDVYLAAPSTPFDGWSPHAEVGAGGAEGSSEHGPEE